MPSGTLTVKLRPLRLAFVVNPRDNAAVLQAIQTCSFLWGGAFNPIVPVFRTFTKRERSIYRGGAPHSVVEGYIEAFDPDFVVLTGGVDTQGLNFGGRETIQCSQIVETIEEDGTPRYGIGLFEIMDHLLATEFKFVRQTPLQIDLPQIDSGSHRLFLSSVFGALPENLESYFHNRLQTIPNVRQAPV